MGTTRINVGWLAVLLSILIATSCSPSTPRSAALDRALGTECSKAWTGLSHLNSWLFGAAYPASEEAFSNLDRLASVMEQSRPGNDSAAPAIRRLIADQGPDDDVRAIHERLFWGFFADWEAKYATADWDAEPGFALRSPKGETPRVLVWHFAAIEDRAEDIILVRGGAFPGDGGDLSAKEATAAFGPKLLDPSQVIVHCDPLRDYAGLDLADNEFLWLNAPGANFEDAELSRTRFFGGDLQGSIFTGATFAYTVFTDVDLRDAMFRDSEVSRLYFDESDLTGADFEGAKGVEEINWGSGSTCPDGSSADGGCLIP